MGVANYHLTTQSCRIPSIMTRPRVSKTSEILQRMQQKMSETKLAMPVPSSRRPCNKLTLTRQGYHSKTEIRAGKTLKQLVLLAVRSFPEKEATFNQVKAILKKDPPNVLVSNYVLKTVLQELRNKNFLTYNTAKFKCTGKYLSSKKPKKNLTKNQRKTRGKQARNLRKSLVTQADRMSKQRKAVLNRVVMKAMRNLKRDAEKSGGRVGFMFMTIKARITSMTKKTLRNVILVEALQRLRQRGVLVLKKARNYICRNKKPKKAAPTAASKKVKKSKKRISKKKPKRQSKRSKSTKSAKKMATRKRKLSTLIDNSSNDIALSPSASAVEQTSRRVFISPEISRLSQTLSKRSISSSNGSVSKNANQRQPTLTQSQAEMMIRESIVTSIKEMKDQVKDMIKNDTFENQNYYRSTG